MKCTSAEETSSKGENEQLGLIEKVCEVLVEEVRRLDKDFWVYQYVENFAGFQPKGTPIVHDEIRVLMSSGLLEMKYLRSLVWFGLGVEKNWNLLDLSFGRFLIIRSDENQYMVAIAKLE